jgi:hypothetical protein
MLRSTSVVMTTIRAPALMLVSPVSRPTASAPYSATSSWNFWLLSAFIGAV